MDNKNNNADVTDGKEKKAEIDYDALLSEYRFSKMDAAYNTVIFLSYVLCLVISFMYTTSPTGCAALLLLLVKGEKIDNYSYKTIKPVDSQRRQFKPNEMVDFLYWFGHFNMDKEKTLQ